MNDKIQDLNGDAGRLDEPAMPTHEVIYLIPNGIDGAMWCDDPAPEPGMVADDAVKYVRAEHAEWLFKTLKWLSDPGSDGGISVCSNHGGHGFLSDCAICAKLKKMSKFLEA